MNRREFSNFSCAVFLMTLPGCGKQSSTDPSGPSPLETSPNPSDPSQVIESVIDASIDIAALFITHPVVKFLSFLKIIDTAIDEIATNTKYDKQGNTVAIPTKNPGVDAIVSVDADEEGEVIFQTPKDTITFAPNHFMRVNNIPYGDSTRQETVDSNLLALYTKCTDATLETGEGNYRKQLELRLSCFEQNGIEKINFDYLRTKHDNFIQT